MGEKHIDTHILDNAIIYAVNAHSGTERRGKDFPYIIHPMEAVAIVATITADQEILAAAVLHDVIEDTDKTYEDIKTQFGDRVASLVASESETVIKDKTEEESWRERKQAAIDRLKNTSRDGKIVAIGDKLSNARAILLDYNMIGDKVWGKFHTKDKKDHEWHYRGLADSLSELSDTDAYKEFVRIIEKLFT